MLVAAVQVHNQNQSCVQGFFGVLHNFFKITRESVSANVGKEIRRHGKARPAAGEPAGSPPTRAALWRASCARSRPRFSAYSPAPLDRANFTRLLIGGIEAKFCKYICV